MDTVLPSICTTTYIYIYIWKKVLKDQVIIHAASLRAKKNMVGSKGLPELASDGVVDHSSGVVPPEQDAPSSFVSPRIHSLFFINAQPRPIYIYIYIFEYLYICIYIYICFYIYICIHIYKKYVGYYSVCFSFIAEVRQVRFV